jgi:hypothetical protein
MNQLGGETSRALDITATPAHIDADVATLGPSRLLQGLPEGRDARLSIRVVVLDVHQSCDATHSIRLLRPRRGGPCRRRAAYERDEVTASHNLASTLEFRLHINVVKSKLCLIIDWERFANPEGVLGACFHASQ